MKSLERAYEYIYQLMIQPITIQECDALQLLNILNGYEDPEYVIEQLKEQVELQLFRERLIQQYGKRKFLSHKVFESQILK